VERGAASGMKRHEASRERVLLLTGGARAGEPRQRTLYAAVDWSYGLLSTRERVVMRRLGAFSGYMDLFSLWLAASWGSRLVDALARQPWEREQQG
jgi:predicted ATPase